MLARVRPMHVAATLVVLGAAVAFALGGSAIARSADVTATYWIVVGFVAVRAAYALVEVRER